ncbi:hypothetical protein BASA50_004371 [Batrachochytrium salamandrivorans]|uniref:Uncharacterized protein n=1 Tax=Batrachochytrium salamandrivorans TaxID=1357716 RepID=A0ABQ8FFX2_9FUNG|nr:hypothetical protein BASA50_004371 [Batrachochytrium salamandrivorans]KAH9275287.1 hypothetical protein BASA83_002054 [Batrachochytrium salamandrivorans]
MCYKSVSQLPQGDPGGISTMWIGTAGTLPAGKSANRTAQYPIIMPRPHRCMLHSPCPTNNWSRSASPFKTPPRSQVYTFSTPGSSARPSNLSRDF